MAEHELHERRNCLPIIYTRGTHYQIGYDIGSTFKSMIQNYVRISKSLHEQFIPLYDTLRGREIYESTLNRMRKNFPQYIEEMQGTADGAQVSFYKLFLMHLDDILSNATDQINPTDAAYGCSTICLNRNNQVYLGHTEDVSPSTMNHIYLVSADIVNDRPRGRWNVKQERFISLCYAGYLPGFAMSYNHHGMISTMNIIQPDKCVASKTPRSFLCRAVLAAENVQDVLRILSDEGCGAADGLSINTIFLNSKDGLIFHNIEVGPPQADTPDVSTVDVVPAKNGEHLYHCNTYLRLKIKEKHVNKSSQRRYQTLDAATTPNCKCDVIKLLGDQSDAEYAIFRDPKWKVEHNSSDNGVTVVTGLFDCIGRTWSIYTDNPLFNEPLLTLPIN